MIRFGAIVTVVMAAVGLLVVGAVAGDLKLVYVSIALAALALLLLIVGVAVWRDEVFASSARRDERDLAPVGTAGRVGRADAGAVESWRDGAVPGPSPTPAAGPAAPGGDTREFRPPTGAPPERDAPRARGRRSGEPRPTEQLQRPAEPAGRPGQQTPHRERVGRDEAAERSGRDAAAERSGRDVAAERSGRDVAAERSGRDVAAERSGRDAAADWSGRDAAAERSGRDVAAGERSARDAGAADWAAREPVPARRPDRVEQYSVFAADRFEPADDPTRLAHRLDSLSDYGRPVDPDAAGSARPPAGRPGQRLPARAGTDPLTGPAAERRPMADPLAASPSAGRPAMPPAELERGADEPLSTWAVPAAAAPATGVPATTKDADSPSPDPVDSGHGASERTTSRTDSAPTRSRGGWPRVPSGAAARMPAEAAPATLADPEVAASPVSLPAHDPAPATAARSAAAPSAAPADARSTAASEPDATASAVPAGLATTETAATDAEPAAAPAVGLDDQVSVVPGIARYHKADCILIRFLSEDDLELMTRRDAEASGCAPCRACRPDRPSEDS